VVQRRVELLVSEGIEFQTGVTGVTVCVYVVQRRVELLISEGIEFQTCVTGVTVCVGDPAACGAARL